MAESGSRWDDPPSTLSLCLRPASTWPLSERTNDHLHLQGRSQPSSCLGRVPPSHTLGLWLFLQAAAPDLLTSVCAGSPPSLPCPPAHPVSEEVSVLPPFPPLSLAPLQHGPRARPAFTRFTKGLCGTDSGACSSSPVPGELSPASRSLTRPPPRNTPPLV